MKILKNKNLLTIILLLLVLLFGYSLFEQPTNIEQNVNYNVNPLDESYQVIHTAKTYGTNYAILAKFKCNSNDSSINIKSVNFKLANFGGIFNYYIDTAYVDKSTNDFHFELKTTFFSTPTKSVIANCNYKIDLEKGYDSHIKIDLPFPLSNLDETNYSVGKLEADLYCCGRQCLFKFTPTN